MCVDAKGRGCVRVTESATHSSYRDSCDQHSRGCKVSKVVEANGGQPDTIPHTDKRFRNIVRCPRSSTIRIAREQVSGVVQYGVAGRCAYFHTISLGRQNGDGPRIKRDSTRRVSLGVLLHDDTVSSLNDRLTNKHCARDQVDVSPAQSANLASASSSGRREVKEGSKIGLDLGCCLKEGNYCRGVGGRKAGRSHAWGLCEFCWIVYDPAPSDRLLKRSTENRVHLVDSRRRERLAIPTALFAELSVEAIDWRCPKLR